MKYFAMLFLILLFTMYAVIFVYAEKKESDPIITHGKEVFMKNNCQKCHTILNLQIGKDNKESGEDDSKGIKAPDLSKLSAKVLSPDPKDAKDPREYLRKYLKKEIKREGKKHKIRFKGADKEFTELIDFLLLNTQRSDAQSTPQGEKKQNDTTKDTQ